VPEEENGQMEPPHAPDSSQQRTAARSTRSSAQVGRDTSVGPHASMTSKADDVASSGVM
jgi:hypothetical protein